jgi:hypothetical protein
MSFGISFPPTVSSVSSLIIYRVAEGQTLSGSYADTDMPLVKYYSQGETFCTNPSAGKILFNKAGAYEIHYVSGGTDTIGEPLASVWVDLYDATDTLIETSTSTAGDVFAGASAFTVVVADVNEYIKVVLRSDTAVSTSVSNQPFYQVIVRKL